MGQSIFWVRVLVEDVAYGVQGRILLLSLGSYRDVVFLTLADFPQEIDCGI